LARIVMKFGGTSMAGTERIRRVANIVRKQQARGHEVAVVVSAMAGETDRLVNFCREANALYDPAEYDVVVASGEQVTSGLLALTLQSLGCQARSWLGWQMPINTIEAHAKARIDSIDADALIASMERGEIAVIPGFQGLSGEGRLTTLGRGGSDTSAVAVAAAIGADRCDIYTDVDGVYTTDPRIVAKARKQTAVTYEEMLELASVGAKVLQTRSVGLAMKEGVRVQVLSSFVGDDAVPADEYPGTMIVSEEEMNALVEKGDMERQHVTGIAHDKNEAKVILTRVPDKPGAVAHIFEPLAAASGSKMWATAPGLSGTRVRITLASFLSCAMPVTCWRSISPFSTSAFISSSDTIIVPGYSSAGTASSPTKLERTCTRTPSFIASPTERVWSTLAPTLASSSISS